jgi:hypothetical protein
MVKAWFFMVLLSTGYSTGLRTERFVADDRTNERLSLAPSFAAFSANVRLTG